MAKLKDLLDAQQLARMGAIKQEADRRQVAECAQREQEEAACRLQKKREAIREGLRGRTNTHQHVDVAAFSK